MLSWCKGVLLFVCCCVPLAALAADTISGTVRNHTSNTAAAGDEVILLRLGDGMQEQARTKTDSRGVFEFQAVPDSHYIVRVMHQGVNYDQVGNGTGLEIAVYDAVAKIRDLGGRMGIAQVEADGGALKVTEMYAIANGSAPPVTQAGPRNFEFSLPPDGTLDSFIVKRAGGIWVKVSLAPVAGHQGRYALDFPLRPGETLFKFSYHFPYDGKASLHLKLAYPIQNFAVVHPPSISFKAARAGTFGSPGEVQGMRLEQAVRKPLVGEVPAFEVSGMGTARAAAGSPLQSAPPVVPTPVAPAGSAGASTSAPTSPKSTTNPTWVVLPGIAAFLAALMFAVWRRRRTRPGSKEAAASSAVRGTRVDALKQELFKLETEKLRGSISLEEYASTKQALTANIERVLARDKS